MADLSRVAEAIPAGGVRKYRGTVVTVGGLRMVSVDGQPLRATWADPLVVDDGDVVDVEVSGGVEGQFAAHVPSRTTLQPRPKTGTVSQVPVSSPTIRVDAAGVTYDAEFIGSYAVNDRVHLDWGAGRPRVIGKVTATDPAVVAPVPAPVIVTPSGQVNAAAIRSDTYYGPGGWGSWAGGGGHVYQGNYGAGPVFGAWFYGSSFSGLAGKEITRVQFRTGARRGVGASSSPATFHFYAHTSPDRPGGDVNRVAGPFDVSVGAGAGPFTLDLPVSFGAVIAAGGGVAIAGDPYAGMVGLQQADSGALILDWKG